MCWLVIFLYGVDVFECWVSDCLLLVEDVECYVVVDDFLWMVWFYLYQLFGGKDEWLSFELQLEIVKCMGFEDIEMESGVECFMCCYFFIVMYVGLLIWLVCFKLEVDFCKVKLCNIVCFLLNMLFMDSVDIGDFIVCDG